MTTDTARAVGARHPLIVYAYGPYRNLRAPALIFGIIALVVWQVGPPILWQTWGQAWWEATLGDGAAPWLIVGVACLLLALLGYVVPRLAYVQCRAEGVRIQGALGALTIPYDCIVSTRSVGFGNIYVVDRVPRRDRGWVGAFIGQTAIAADVRRLPYALWFMRAMLDRYVFSAEEKVLCFLVKDWMTLSREIEHFRARSQDRARDARAPKDAADQVFQRLAEQNQNQRRRK